MFTSPLGTDETGAINLGNERVQALRQTNNAFLQMMQVRRDVKKGDIAMVITSSFNGERVTAQCGSHIVTFMGTQLRPLPEYEDEE